MGKFLTIFSGVVFAALLFPSISNAQSEEPKVTFEKEELKEVISQETLDYLLEQSGGDDITIHNVIENPTISNGPISLQPVSPQDGVIQPMAIWHSYSVNSVKFTHRSPLAAQQYASVARGKTVTMSRDFTSTNTVGISGETPEGAAGVISANFGSSKSKTIKRGVTLKGPPEGYSSRNYYITRFKDYGTFKLVEKNIFTGSKKTYSKSYSKPSSQDPFVDWSRDIK